MRLRFNVIAVAAAMLCPVTSAAIAADPLPCEKLTHWDATLRDPLIQRQLMASGVLNADVGHATQLDLRQALCVLRLVHGRPPTAAFDDTDRAVLKQNFEEFGAWAGFQNIPILTADRIKGPQFLITIPAPMAALPKFSPQEPLEKPNGNFNPFFTSADASVRLEVYSYGAHRFTPELFLQHVLSSKAAPSFYFMSNNKNGFVLEGEDKRPNNLVRQFHHRIFVDSGRLKGFGFHYPQLPPPTFVPLPAYARLAGSYATIPERLRDPHPGATPAPLVQSWQRQNMALANFVASDFEGLNGRADVSTTACEMTSPPPEASGTSRIRVVFGTDREPLKPSGLGAGTVDPDSLFGPAPIGELHIGCAVISTPQLLDDNRYLRYRSAAQVAKADTGKSVDAAQYFAVDHFVELKPETGTFAENIAVHDRARPGTSGKALIFVHGFNVSFAEALFRAAQIAQSSGYKGRVYLYSWPSRRKVQSYIDDIDNAEQSEVFFRAFLRGIMRDHSIRQFDFIAHSMGAQTLLRTLVELKDEFLASAAETGLAGSGSTVGRQLGQVIFAAPDIGYTVFSTRIRDLIPYATRVTLYASSTDRAMYASRKLRGGTPRAGDTAALEKIKAPGLQLIDASRTTRWFDLQRYIEYGHSDFAERKGLITDIADVLSERVHRLATPDRRRPGQFKRVPADPAVPAQYYVMSPD